MGTPITWTYQVFNDGAGPIRITSIVDDFGTPGSAADDFGPAAVTVVVGGASYNTGDANRNNLLDAGEAWLYTSAGTAAGGYQAVVGPYTNVARVVGTVVTTGAVVQDEDAVHYVGVPTTSVVSVRLEKAVNAADPGAPTPYEDADTPTGPIQTVGSTVVWTYLLSNTGNVAVAVSTLRDDAGHGLSILTDDFTPAPVLTAGTTFNIGDANRDNLLDVNEVWRYRASGTVAAGQYTNNATATVSDPVGGTTASSSDPANYYGSQAGLRVVKAVNAVKPLQPTAAEDANNPATPVVLAAGTSAVFTYAVSNTGNDSLASRDAGGRQRNGRHRGRRLRARAGDHRGRWQGLQHRQTPTRTGSSTGRRPGSSAQRGQSARAPRPTMSTVSAVNNAHRRDGRRTTTRPTPSARWRKSTSRRPSMPSIRRIRRRSRMPTIRRTRWC